MVIGSLQRRIMINSNIKSTAINGFEKIIPRCLFLFWQRVYAKPVKEEIGWSIFSFCKTSVVTFLAWLPVVDVASLIAVTFVNSTKNLLINRYRHTLRNIFNFHKDKGTLVNFLFYFSKRIAFSVFTGFFVLLTAIQFDVFSWASLYMLVTSRVFNSTRYIVNAYEDKLIYSGYINRSMAARIAGSTSLIRAYIENIDLAGITLYGIRPFWLNIFISVALIIFYMYRKLRIDLQRKRVNYGPQTNCTFKTPLKS